MIWCEANATEKQRSGVGVCFDLIFQPLFSLLIVDRKVVKESCKVVEKVSREKKQKDDGRKD